MFCACRKQIMRPFRASPHSTHWSATYGRGSLRTKAKPGCHNARCTSDDFLDFCMYGAETNSGRRVLPTLMALSTTASVFIGAMVPNTMETALIWGSLHLAMTVSGQRAAVETWLTRRFASCRWRPADTGIASSRDLKGYVIVL